MDHSLQYLQSVQAEDLPPNQQTCNLCKTPWSNPRNPNAPPEYPIILTCGCIAGSLCLKQSFQKNPRCPLCHTTIRIIAGMRAPRNQNQSTGNRNHDYLQQLELRAGIAKWPIPSIETRSPRDSREGSTYKQAEQQMKQYDLRDKLGVLNSRHGTHLSILELEVCVSLVDYRLGSTTSTNVVLDEFLNSPLLFDAPRWKRSANDNPYMAAKSKMPSSQHDDDDDDDDEIGSNKLVPGADADDVRTVLKMINMRAGTSFLLNELAVVVSLMNHLYGRAIGLLDVLGLRDGGQQSRLSESQVVGAELMRGLGTLNICVGAQNGGEDLGEVSSRRGAREARRRRG